MTSMDWYVRHITLTQNEGGRENQAKKGKEEKLSIFYTLEYWKSLKITHLLDPMHIFKNVGEQLWRHLVGDADSQSGRKDLEVSRSKPFLWPKEDDNGTIHYAPAPWVLNREELKIVETRMRSIRTPTGYGASVRDAFTAKGQLSKLKSHDWHNMIQVRTVLF